MSLTIRFDEHETARLTDERIETVSRDRIEFVAEGNLTVTESKMAAVAGRTLRPTTVTLTVEDERPVPIDLTGPATLRLEDADVGIEPAGTDAVPSEATALESTTDDGPNGADPTYGVLSFTVDGAVQGVPEETVDRLAGSNATLRSITFTLDDETRSNGGTNDTVLAVTLLGFGVLVQRNGVVRVGIDGRVPGV
ncbi:hypothetical protein [Halovivax limisalsi]|uniref:hypothetical protein n=1 Tax=Halovivax limisalsi TaxID=1453760 RepID=UPI001FFD61DD|nr:hypothetical protein [Halovivax limisalsi]